MYYGADLADSYRRVAYYVDKILKGAKPADLPVEQPTKFELVINLKTAKQIGLTIPPNVLARAVMDELAGKRIQLLKEINSKLSSSGVLWNPAHADNELREIQITAKEFNVQLRLFKVDHMDEFDNALSAMKKDKFDALIVVPSRLTLLRRSQLAGFALKSRIPMASGWREFAEAGGLLSYGPDRAQIARRIAYYVDRILKGAKPADLPVETPTKFELVINLKTAQEIGLTIPQSVLYRADTVIR
jgi:putative ABC transport system substrate-binding protein